MLKIPAAEDNPASRRFLSKFLFQYGECEVQHLCRTRKE